MAKSNFLHKALRLALGAGWILSTASLDNGLARTPPMGWLSWERFLCNTDCKTYPDTCISEKLYINMADRLAEDGWHEAGYVQVNIDDCWSTFERDPITNKQRPDPDRFPSGIKYLADYMHKRGLKLGLYSDIGTKTCAGYLGMEGFFELDANTFASWGIDMLKVDGCNADISAYNVSYPALGRALNATGRPIIYSCSWPAYLGPPYTPPHIPYDDLAENCNLWRTFDDIQDGWSSVQKIIDHWDGNESFVGIAGPGHWNDPDMLMIGNFGLSHQQERTQFALWAIFAAPLLMSNDLRNIPQASREILLNKDIIAVNQDILGKQGKVVQRSGAIRIWLRELEGSDCAIVVENRDNTGSGQYVSIEANIIPGLVDGGSFLVRDLFLHKDLGIQKGVMEVFVRPSSVEMFRISRIR